MSPSGTKEQLDPIREDDDQTAPVNVNGFGDEQVGTLYFLVVKMQITEMKKFIKTAML